MVRPAQMVVEKGGVANFEDGTEDGFSVDGFEAVLRSADAPANTKLALTKRESDSGNGQMEQGKEVEEDQDVPEILYVVHYLGVIGNVVLDSLKSPTPFTDIPAYNTGKVEKKVKKKPVFDILTRVNTVAAHESRPIQDRYPQGRLGGDPYYPRRCDDNDDIDDIDDIDDNVQYCDTVPARPVHSFEVDRTHQRSLERSISKVSTPVMRVFSRHLINALQKVVKYYPFIEIQGGGGGGGSDHHQAHGGPVRFDAPYRVLVHHMDELAAYKTAQPACHDDEYRRTTSYHIDLLLGFLKDTLGDKIREERERNRRATPVATFENYWMLLKPGEVIMASSSSSDRANKDSRDMQAYVISSVNQMPKPDGRVGSWNVCCWSLGYTGHAVTRSMSRHVVHAWNGECPIATLPVVPAAFYQDDLEAQEGMTILDWQEHLGRKYWNLLQKPTYLEYDGMLHGRSADMYQAAETLNRRAASGYTSGRVVVDAVGWSKENHGSPGYYDGGMMPQPRVSSYDQGPQLHRNGRHLGNRDVHEPVAVDFLPHYEPRCGCDACGKAAEDTPSKPLYDRFSYVDPRADEAPESATFFVALTSLIPAFIVGDRRWGHVHVANLRPVKTDREAFKWLVLDEDIKTTIRALVSEYATDNDPSSIAPWVGGAAGGDFVRNKGEGRIFLLHGSPGVGKTCTAEAIAELTGRPLISITPGDLTTDEYRVEAELSYYLRLGQRYGALVLLDEADVYLERRHSQDIARNGLVSVFLRALEYYRGLLFLTTNRVRTFDPAFTSRVHVALHYRPLTNSDREHIWINHFERLERGNFSSVPTGKSDGNNNNKNNNNNNKNPVPVHVSAGVREYAYLSEEVMALHWNGREIRNAAQTALALAAAEAREDERDHITITDKHLRAVVRMSRGFKEYLQRGHDWEEGLSDVVDDEEEGGSSIFDE